MTLPNGNMVVTLKAVISVSKLISYAQSKGSSAEFAGATFGMNMKLKELNKANEERAIYNLIVQLIALAPDLFDYKLELGEPRLGEGDKDTKPPLVKGEYYELPATVYALYNDNTEMANMLLLKTLASLSLSAKEREEYKCLNIPYVSMSIGNISNEVRKHWLYHYDVRNYDVRNENSRNLYEEGNIFVALRSSMSSSKLCEYCDAIGSIIINFKIVDNTGGVSTVDAIRFDRHYIKGTGFSGLIRSSIIWPCSKAYFSSVATSELHICHLFKKYLDEDICYRIDLTLVIPKDDIMKYNNFTITRR
jgi:hypothetical protein